MRKFFIVVLTLLSVLTLSAQNKVILEIDKEKIDADEFLHIYQKNSKTDGEPTYKDLENYMDLFVNFKLKVHEGTVKGYDTVAEFKQEIAGYKKQLAQPYLTDKNVEDNLIKEAYDRMLYDVDVSHILIKLGSNPSPEDTLKAWNKINAVYKKLEKGGDFETLAVQNSQDPSVTQNKGRLGYCTVFGLVYDFETVMYETKVGAYSHPFRTKYGYHILKIHDKRQAKGRYNVAHIMVVSPKDASDEEKQKAKQNIEEIYEKLKSGADFAKMAEEYSADRKTAVKGGEIGWINVGGRMIKEFETAAFSIENVGEISEIVPTGYGYHIIKLLGKEDIKPFDQCKAEIKTKLSNNARSSKSRDCVIAKLIDEYKIQKYPKNVVPFYTYVTDTIFSGKWAIDSTLVLDKPILVIKDKKYTQKDFARYLEKYNRKQTPMDIVTMIDNSFKNFCDKHIIEYEEDHLEEKYPSFKYLMKEYHDGVLLFSLTNKEVWTKAIEDTIGLQAFYEKNKENYKWGYRYEIKTFKCQNPKVAGKLKKALSSNFDDEAIISKLNKKDSSMVVLGEKALSEKAQSLFVDNIVRVNEIPETAGFVKVTTDKDNVVTAVRVVAPTIKKLTEIKGIVTAAYQDSLEKQWIEELQKKYKITIHENVLKDIYKTLTEK